MKSLSLLFFLAVGLAVAEPDFSHLKVEPLPFPTGKARAADLKLPQLEARAERLNQKVGGYPPRLKDAADRKATYKEWSAVVLAAEAVEATGKDTERRACLLARLYRQGHNLDVKESGERAKRAVEDALKTYPDSVPVQFEASYLYLQINPKFAPEGEKALLRLRELLGTDQNPEVERGFVFAYLYQNRIPEAQAQIDRCLALTPGDKMLLQFKEALKKGKLERKEH